MDVVHQLSLSEPFRGLVRACETVCEAKCCGTSAFDISAENVTAWVTEVGPTTAARALEEVERQLGTIRARGGAGVVSSGWEDFNTSWPAPEAAKFFEVWRVELATAIDSAER